MNRALNLLVLAIPALVSGRHYKFALCPKFINNGYFDISRDGCVDRAMQISMNSDDTVECLYVGTDVQGEFPDLQRDAILQALEEHPDLDGLSISVTQGEELRPAYDRAAELGIPVVTFDSDDDDIERSRRIAYIGTDNFFMGQQLSKVLQKLAPLGGTYAILTSDAPNLQERADGIQYGLDSDPNWELLEGEGLVNYAGNNSAALPLMQ